MEIDLYWANQKLNSTPIIYTSIPNSSVNVRPIRLDVSNWPTVKNQTRCFCWYDKKNTTFSTKPYPQNNKKIIKIALIVESPHKDEFTIEFEPLQPLNGASGRAFENHIIKKMNNWFCVNQNDSAIYQIKVFNPVQQQASLHHFLNNLIDSEKLDSKLLPGTKIPPYSLNDKKHRNNYTAMRDQVWKLFFQSDVTNNKRFFQEEIIRYYPQYIINACTGKSEYKNDDANWKSLQEIPYSTNFNLKDIVRDSLLVFKDEILQNFLYREENHPFHWVFEKENKQNDK